MAITYGGLTISMPAGEDLSSHQFNFVKNSSGTIKLIDAEDDEVLGVLQNAPESGEDAAVQIDGVTKIVANAALTVDSYVKPEYVSATDNGKAQAAATLWAMMRGKVLVAAGAEDDVATIQLLPDQPPRLMPLIGHTTVTTTGELADNLTLTAAQLLGGLIRIDCGGSARNVTLPLATSIIAAVRQYGVGNSFIFAIENVSNGAEAITVVANTGNTLNGVATIARTYCALWLVVITASTTCAVYKLTYSVSNAT